MREWYSTHVYWIALAIFALILVPTILAYSGHQRESAYEEYATHQAYADAEKNFFEKCFSIAVVDELRGCLADAIESAREPQRSEEDVRAQKDMALYALWMLTTTTTLGVFTFAATVIGAVFVWRSIQDNREQFAVDRRPWLTMGRPRVRVRLGGGDDIMVWLQFRVANIGKSPTTDAELFISASGVTLPTRNNIQVIRFARTFLGKSDWFENHRIIFPNKSRAIGEISEWVPLVRGGTTYDTLKVLYCLTYTAPGIKSVLRTAGEVIFRIDKSASDPDGFVSVERFIHYGVAFAD